MNKQSQSKSIISSLVAAAVTGLAVGCLVGLSASPTVQAVLTVIMGSVAAIIAAISGIREEKITGTISKALSNNKKMHGEEIANNASDATDSLADKQSINPWPLAIFVSFLLFGSGIGLFARTHNWLGSYGTVQEKTAWTELGFKENEVKDALYSQRFPMSSKARMLRLSTIETELAIWERVGISRTVVAKTLLENIYGSQEPINQGRQEEVSQELSQTMGGLKADRTEVCRELRNMKDKYDISTALFMSLEERWRPLSVITDTLYLEEIMENDLCPRNLR